MAPYSMEMVAAELMLTREEMKEICELYFADAEKLIQECEVASSRQDYVEAFKAAHALKGAAANLRMDTVAEDAQKIEELLQTRQTEEMAELLYSLQQKIGRLKNACA